MGKVILGAILGAAVGLLIGWLPRFDYSWEIVPSGSRVTLPLDHLLHPLSMMIGMAAGGIIGAIAGRVAADPNSTPLPGWVVVVVVGVLLLGLLGAGVFLLMPRSAPVMPRPSEAEQPAREARPRENERLREPEPEREAPRLVPPVRPPDK